MKTILSFICLGLTILSASVAYANNASDDRDGQLCSQLVIPVAYEVYNQKKQGYSPDDSYDKIAGGFRKAMDAKQPASGEGADIINDFNNRLAKSHVKLIHDMILDAANRPFFHPDKAYPQYVLRCLKEVWAIKADIAQEHRNELQQFQDQ